MKRKLLLFIAIINVLLMPLYAYADLAISPPSFFDILNPQVFWGTIATIIIEAITAAVVLKKFDKLRKIRFIEVISLSNLISFPIFVYFLFYITIKFNIESFIVGMSLLAFLEASVILFEFLVVYLALKKLFGAKKILTTVFWCNFVSCLTGIVLMALKNVIL